MTIESVTPESLSNLRVNLTLKNSKGEVALAKLNEVFDLEPGEVKRILVSQNLKLNHGTYLLQAEVIGYPSISRTYMHIYSGAIMSFNGSTLVKQGDDITFEVSFLNTRSADVLGKPVMYLYDSHNIKIGELHFPLTIIPANSERKIQMTWNTAGQEQGVYKMLASVDTGREFFGSTLHTFQIMSTRADDKEDGIRLTYQQLGLLLEVVGVIVILLVQLRFVAKTYSYYGKRNALKRAFLDLAIKKEHEKEGLNELSNEEVDRIFKKFNFSRWFYLDFIASCFGLFLILTGILIQVLPWI